MKDQEFTANKIAVICHLYYPDYWPDLANKIRNIPVDFHLYVTVAEDHYFDLYETIKSEFKNADIRPFPNSGRDVAPFVRLLPELQAQGYEVVCKIHTKKGAAHSSMWGKLLIDSILGSPEIASLILNEFAADPLLGMVGSDPLYVSARAHQYGNMKTVKTLWRYLHNGANVPDDWGFFAGTMFWARTEPLAKLAEILKKYNFEEDNSKTDGQLAHAFERLFGLSVFNAGCRIGLIENEPGSGLEKIFKKVNAPGNPSLNSIVDTLAREEEKSKQYRFFYCNRAYRENRPNILLVAHAAGKEIFGAERCFIDLVQEAARLNVNLYLCFPEKSAECIRQCIDFANGIIIFKYAQWTDNNPQDNRTIDIFTKIISDFKINLVHVNTIMIREPLTAARKLGEKSVIHVHELIDRDPDLVKIIGVNAEKVIEQVLGSADYIIANSQETASLFNKPGATYIIPNTIDINAFDISNDIGERLKVAMVSSNIPKKGIRDFAILADECNKQQIDAHFFLVGPFNHYIYELIEKNKTRAGNLFYGGYFDKSVEAIAAGNLIVNFSSFAESFGLTVLEAMASRRPVIAYSWGALPELINDQHTGYLIPYQNVQAAVPIVKKLAENPALVRQMGNQARDVAVAHYDKNYFSRQVAKVYSSILEDDSVNTAICINPGANANKNNQLMSGNKQPSSLLAQPGPQEKSGISIIIVNYSELHHLDRLFSTFIRYNTYQPIEFVILDHGPGGQSGPVIKKWAKNIMIKYFKRDRSNTYSASVNIGAQNATYPNLLIMHQDIIFTDDLLPLAVAQLADETIGAVGCRIDHDCSGLDAGNYPSVKHVGIKFDWDEQFAFHRPYQLGLYSTMQAEEVPSAIYPAVAGDFLLCRKKDFFAVGGYHENYDHGFEDVDFCLHLKENLNRKSLSINSLSLHQASSSDYLSLDLEDRKKLQENNIQIFKSRTASFKLKYSTMQLGKSVKSLNSENPGNVTVIVPVYNALEETLNCLDSLVNNIEDNTRVIVIDDCSPDSALWPALVDYERRCASFFCVRNEVNLGYTATINKGIRMADGDVVLLNSDTMVTSNWLAKMRNAAYSKDNIATVTPLSNAAGAFSLPENNQQNFIPEGVTLEQMANLVDEESPRLWPVVPTGNGFCMYIRRKALDKIGLFDEKSFPRGYGEENDFCQRAIKFGFLNIIDDATFIYHKCSASFKESKDIILPESERLMSQRWPEYHKEVRGWLSNDPLDSFRICLKEKLKK